MVKELVEAAKQIHEILEWAEATDEGFATLVNRIQTEVKVQERKSGGDEEQETQDAYERVSASWGVRTND